MTVVDYFANDTWTAPAGVTSVDVECVGGGGGARGGVVLGRGGGGGKGGSYSFKTITVVPGNLYAIVVGAGGSGSPYNSNTQTAGSISSFDGTSVVAAGGGAAGAGGTGATAVNGTSVGTTINAGTDGAASVAGSGTAGGAGGAGGTPLGGTGGAGGTTGSGSNGTSPGGGGGGGKGNTSGTVGGDGAAGMVRLTFTPATLNVDATITESVTVTATGVVGKIAAAAVAVGVAITATAVVNSTPTATRSVGVGVTATAVVGKSATASVPVGVSITATASVGTILTATATRSVGVGITATATTSSALTATRSVGVGVTAAALAQPAGSATYSTPGTYSWVAPAGVTAVQVELVGGGGGGGAGDHSGLEGGAGGKGGSYAKSIVAVVPGNSYSVVVGAGGTCAPGDSGTAGGVSRFNTTTVIAGGGNGGFQSDSTPTTGSGASTGTTVTTGTNGAGGSVPNGGDGGAGAVPWGGAGGTHTTIEGNPGTSPGGGGAGGSSITPGSFVGGTGGDGLAIITVLPAATATRSVGVTITATANVAASRTATVPVGVAITASATTTPVLTVSATPVSIGVSITATATVSGAPAPTVVTSLVRPPGRMLVRVASPGSTRPAYVNKHGIVGNLNYRWGLPGGPLDASFAIDVLPNASIPELTVGSTVEITRGAAVVWRGRVNTLSKGTPWEVGCDGLGGLATRETSLDKSGLIDAIVDDSIADGLPWTRPATLGNFKWSDDSDGPITTKLDEVLSTTLTLQGKRWTVSNTGVLSAVNEPAGLPTLLVRINDPSVPVGFANYATRVQVRYNDGTTGFPVETVINAAAEAQYGRVAVSLYAPWADAHTASQAHAFGQAFLDRNSPRLTITGGFTISYRQITTVSGGVIDLPDVASVVGKIARLQFAVPLFDSQLGAVSTIDFPIGAASYDDDDATLTLEPIDNQDTPLQTMLAGAMAARSRIV